MKTDKRIQVTFYYFLTCRALYYDMIILEMQLMTEEALLRRKLEDRYKLAEEATKEEEKAKKPGTTFHYGEVLTEKQKAAYAEYLKEHNALNLLTG